ncbi:APC family permease [Rhodococcus triatomae]|nr:APC family permease [Rhodococcus triatomae]QNG25546.1 APC family permease [Rhodococcus triatomae]
MYSPLHALGRRQLSPIDLLGQSLSTIAPATGMVFIALWMVSHQPGVTGLAAIAATTAVVSLVAVCITQFTRRLAAAGSLYSFVFQGLSARATLTTGTALLLGYLGISISVLANAADSLLGVAVALGHRPPQPGAQLAVVALIAVTVTVIAVRGVRFATRAILVVEICSLALIVAVMIGSPAEASTAAAVPHSPMSIMPFLAMLTVLSMAGFESSAFFGPEAKRPLATVSRTVLISPVICGALFVFAAWAALAGHGSVIVGAYFEGTASGASVELVLAVKIGMTCSWFASTLGCAQAGSRLLYSMGVERVLPTSLARVHRRFRTPYVAVTTFTVAGLGGALLFSLTVLGDAAGFNGVVEIALVSAYTLVAAASLRFLNRIGEHTVLSRAAAVAVTLVGGSLLVYIVVDGVAHRFWAVPAALVTIALSGTVWYRILRRVRPDSLATIGAFDSVETADILPGAGRLVIDDDGRRRILPDPGPGPHVAGGDRP